MAKRGKIPNCEIGVHGHDLLTEDLKAHQNGIYSVESAMSGVRIMYDDGCIIVLTKYGWAKMPVRSAEVIANEILDIVLDLEDVGLIPYRSKEG